MSIIRTNKFRIYPKSTDSMEHIALLDPNDIAVRIEELNEIKDGWFNGFGFPLNREGLAWLFNKFDTYYPEELILPYLYPTTEGKVQAEWTIANFEISLEIDIENHQGEWQSLEMTQLNECFKELNLNNEKDWQWVTAKIRNLLEVGEGEASHEPRSPHLQGTE